MTHSQHYRFWSKIVKGANGCWDYANQPKSVYPLFKWNGTHTTAHRIAYEEFFGPIPEGLTVDHLCKNTRCVNPAHLEAVSAKVNALRGQGPCAKNLHKTHCKHGHPFEGENLILRTQGGRACRTCLNEGQRRRKKENPEKFRKWQEAYQERKKIRDMFVAG